MEGMPLELLVGPYPFVDVWLIRDKDSLGGFMSSYKFREYSSTRVSKLAGDLSIPSAACLSLRSLRVKLHLILHLVAHHPVYHFSESDVFSSGIALSLLAQNIVKINRKITEARVQDK